MARHKEQNLRVLVVWEPILPSDLKSPSASNLARIADQRARQFWDPHHLVAAAMNESLRQSASRPEAACCFSKGFYWDDAILYPARAQWENAPPSSFWNGPVYRVIPNLEKALSPAP